MDALDLLKSDHERVSSLYGQFKAGGPEVRPALLGQIKSELLTHSQIEESVFYPAFKNYPDFQDLIAQSYNDHRDIHSMIQEAKAEDPSTVDRMISKVAEHVKVEEEQFFPMVRKLMKRSEREVLGRHLLAAKSDQAAAA